MANLFFMIVINSMYVQQSSIYSNRQYTFPQFGSYKTTFSKKLEEVIAKKKVNKEDKTFLSRELNNILDGKLSKRFLGEGVDGQVYKIDDKFVMKTSHSILPEDVKFDSFGKKQFASLKSYYGEPVAKFSDITILKNVSSTGKHVPVGVPDNIAIKSSKEEFITYYEKYYLPRFADLPQKSYNCLAQDLNRLNKMGRGLNNFKFDYFNPNNFVLVCKSLRITDEIFKTFKPNENTTAKMLGMFLKDMNRNCVAVYNKDVVPERKEILKKVILSGMNSNLPLGINGEDKDIWKYTVNNLCRIKTPASNMIKELDLIQKTSLSPKSRVQKTEKYLEEIM